MDKQHTITEFFKAIDLYYVDRLSCADIAKRLKIPTGIVSAWLQKFDGRLHNIVAVQLMKLDVGRYESTLDAKISNLQDLKARLSIEKSIKRRNIAKVSSAHVTRFPACR